MIGMTSWHQAIPAVCIGLGATLAAQVEGNHQDARETGREVRGQEPGRPPGIPREQLAGESWPILGWRHATGTWGGVRTTLEEHGVTPEVFMTVDASALAAGGVDRGATALRMLLDATLTVDTARAMGLPGGQLFLDYQVQRGEDGSLDAGGLQASSNIDGDDRSQLAKAWYEQVLFDASVRVKLGKADANTDFAFVEHGFRLLNASFGFSPTILGFPTYPDPSFGASVFVHPGAGLYLGAGVYDGARQAGVKTGQRGPQTLFGSPADLFVVAEAGLRWQQGDGKDLPGRVGVGGWRHSGSFMRWRGGIDDGTDGLYLVADQLLWRPNTDDDDQRGLGGFLQLGFADRQVSAIAQHLGVGLSFTGPSRQRPADAVGVGVTSAWLTHAAGAGLRGDAEVATEVFYTLQATPWLRIKPDVQWIHNPGGVGAVDAWVLTLRLAMTF